MSIKREVVKYMALPYNGIIAAIKHKKNDDILCPDIGRHTAHGEVHQSAEKPFCTEGRGRLG